MRIRDDFEIKTDVPLPNGLRNEEVKGLNARDRQLLLKKRVCASWENSVNGKVTFKFIRDGSSVENRPDFDFSVHLVFLLTGRGSLNALRGMGEAAQKLLV